MSGELFQAACPHCRSISYLEYDVLYHDLRNEAMIWVLHRNAPGYEAKLEELRSGNGMPCKMLRVVENVSALSEKVACLENGRDDRIVELYKVFAVRNLLKQDPGFAFVDMFYSAVDGREMISVCDENGKIMSSGLMDEIYDFIRFMYLDSDFEKQYDNNYPIIDYAWAEGIFASLMETAEEKLTSVGVGQEYMAQIRGERAQAVQKRAALSKKTDIMRPVIGIVIAFAILFLISVPLAKGTQKNAFNSQLRNFATEEMNDDFTNTYADVVSIIPEYYVATRYGSSDVDITDIICECETVEGKTIWVAIKVWEYPGGGSTDPSENKPQYYSKTNPMRLTGRVDPAEKVGLGLGYSIGDVFVLCVREMQVQ